LILLSVSAMVLMISASSAIVSLWMGLALAPVPPSEWPISPPPFVPSLAVVPRSDVAASALLPAPEAAAETTPAADVSVATAAPSPITTATSKPATPAAAVTNAQAPAVAADHPITPGAGEVSTILAVLDRYRLALSSLNPGSVRTVWPAADVRALSRDFADIKRQTLAFDNCRIDVQGVQAEAVCDGRVSLVTRTGPQRAHIESRHWMFTLVYQSDAWKIRTVDSIDRSIY
jgi:hypothetical protein